MHTTIRGRRRTTTATAAIVEPTSLEALAAPQTKPAAAARVFSVVHPHPPTVLHTRARRNPPSAVERGA